MRCLNCDETLVGSGGHPEHHTVLEDGSVRVREACADGGTFAQLADVGRRCPWCLVPIYYGLYCSNDCFRLDAAEEARIKRATLADLQDLARNIETLETLQMLEDSHQCRDCQSSIVWDSSIDNVPWPGGNAGCQRCAQSRGVR